MNFLNPIALFGLFAATIPLVLHLLNLRKLKIIEFSSLRFLKELQKTKIRRLKLKQIILLILRTLVIIFAILALARPAIEGTLPGFGSYAKTSAIIIIDNSFSMDVSDESGNRFTQARNAALSIINEMKEGDEAVIIETDQSGTDKSISSTSDIDFTRNIQYLKEKLSKIKVSYRKANLEKSLRTAAGLIDKAHNLNREIFIISDAQNNIFVKDFDDSVKLFSNIPVVYFVKIGADSENGIMNLSVDSINIYNRIYQYNKLVETEATISNGSEKDINGLVVSMYFNDERVAQRNIDIPARETKSLNISASPKQYGFVRARINIEEDALNIDNNRHFGFIIPDKPKVALIGREKDIKFITYILDNSSGFESPALTEIFNPKQIPGINFTDYEMLILAGGPYLKSDFRKISQYIKNGGSCLIFADESTDLGILKEGLSELGFGDIKQRNFPDDNPGAFTMVDKIHPLFEGVFKGTTDNRAVVESPNIYKAFINNGGQAIINITGGNFLSESRLGDGKALYCSVTPDASWSSFPLTGLFPTIIYRSIVYLSAREGLGSFATAGEPVMLSLPKKFSSGNDKSAGSFKIIDPNGNEFYQQAVMLPSGAVLSLRDLNVMGVYSIYSSNDRIIDLISVNPPASESILTTADDSKIIELLYDSFEPDTKINIISESKQIMNKVNRLRTGTELWQIFIILALVCLTAEMLISRNTRKEAIE
ncbi:BatA domain-containing protein [Bacteroidota bacterium]